MKKKTQTKKLISAEKINAAWKLAAAMHVLKKIANLDDAPAKAGIDWVNIGKIAVHEAQEFTSERCAHCKQKLPKTDRFQV